MITASVVFYNSISKDIETILRCAHNSSISTIYVVDNASNRDIEYFVKGISTKIIYIQGHGNVGYGAGHNIAIQKAIEINAEYHVVLNPDIYFDCVVIENLFKFMDSHTDIGLLLPKVTYPDGTIQYLCKLLPTPLDVLGRRLLPKSWMKKRNDKYEMRFTGYDKIRNCPILSGCFMFIRTSVLREVGLFDERFFMYFEDFDLTRRIHQVSKTVYYPRVTIIHAHAAEHRTSKFLLKKSIISTIKYFNKWGWIFDRERKVVNNDSLGMHNIIE